MDLLYVSEIHYEMNGTRHGLIYIENDYMYFEMQSKIVGFNMNDNTEKQFDTCKINQIKSLKPKYNQFSVYQQGFVEGIYFIITFTRHTEAIDEYGSYYANDDEILAQISCLRENVYGLDLKSVREICKLNLNYSFDGSITKLKKRTGYEITKGNTSCY